jgi:uncharacterized protein YcaQ
MARAQRSAPLTPAAGAASVRTISSVAARRLAISVQLLEGSESAAGVAPGPERLLDTVRATRCLQLDPISVVARSHQLVLWSRVGPYDREDLDILLWKDRSLFEYWAHRASIVLTEDYPIHSVMMRGYPKGDRPYRIRAREWMRANDALRKLILRRLTLDGPLPSRAFEDRSQKGWRSSGWTNERNVTRMLDMLWTQGRIMVAGRDGLQKIWDLSERCLPEWTPRERLSEAECVHLAAQHSLRALGVGTEKHIREHFIDGRYPGLGPMLMRLGQEGRITPIRIADGDVEWPGTWYVHSDRMELLDRIERGDWRPRTTLLSPFDNLIIARDRTEALFDFYYRMEIYVPRPKRKYGYYAMPILHGDRIVGLVDPSMDRTSSRLTIRSVHVTAPRSALGAGSGAGVRAAIHDLARFLGAAEIDFETPVPEPWRRALTA